MYLDYLYCIHSLQNTSTSTYLGRVGDSGTLNAGGDMGPAKYRENSSQSFTYSAIISFHTISLDIIQVCTVSRNTKSLSLNFTDRNVVPFH